MVRKLIVFLVMLMSLLIGHYFFIKYQSEKYTKHIKKEIKYLPPISIKGGVPVCPSGFKYNSDKMLCYLLIYEK